MFNAKTLGIKRNIYSIKSGIYAQNCQLNISQLCFEKYRQNNLIYSYSDGIIICENNYSLIDKKKEDAMGNYYSYKRISTDSERQNFNRQIKSLERYALEHGIDYLIEFTEEKSAKNFNDRTQFKKLDKLIKAGDTVVFKDLSRFTREAENGYKKYMEWLDRGISMVFIDNPTVSSDYIRQMMNTAEKQDIVTKTAMEGIIKLLLIVELDRAEQQRRYISKAITDGIKASPKKSGRSEGSMDKFTDKIKEDIKLYLKDRHITQTELMKKHGISRNTLKKYISYVEKLNGAEN